MTFKMSGEDTGEAYSLTDSMVPHQGGPLPHIHHREVSVGENRFKAGAGSFVHVPKGALHSYQNVGTYSPECVEGAFPELRPKGVLRSSPLVGWAVPLPPLCFPWWGKEAKKERSA
jgi:hypothetical protein